MTKHEVDGYGGGIRLIFELNMKILFAQRWHIIKQYA